MLDYLWQRNLRQFIYKVGRTGPGRVLPSPPLPVSLIHRLVSVFQNIIHSAAPLGDEMAHHLYVLQALTLGLLEPRMRTPIDPYSQVHVLGEAQIEHDLELGLESQHLFPCDNDPRSNENSCRPCVRLPLSQRGTPWALG
jgi:hypothetical protein